MTKEEDKRINPSISESCWTEIDRVIDESGLFNGRTDFVYSAIRSFIIESITRFRAYIAESKSKGETPFEIVSLFEEATTRYGSSLLESYSKKYPGPSNKQIPIRPDEPFRMEIISLSNYLFKNDGQEELSKTCRVAIHWYLEIINDAIENDDYFENELEKMRKADEKRRVDIGI